MPQLVGSAAAARAVDTGRQAAGETSPAIVLHTAPPAFAPCLNSSFISPRVPPPFSVACLSLD